MSNSLSQERKTYYDFIIGAAFWQVVWLFPLAEGVLDLISKLLLLAIMAFISPLLFLVAPHQPLANARPYQIAYALRFVAIPLAMTSFLLPVGSMAALLAGGWLFYTLLLALYGLLRLLPWRWPRPEELCISAGLLYLPVGAGWLVLSRLGVNPLGFSDAIVLLTAVHFHYAAFVMPILVGMSGRALARMDAPAWASTLYRAIVAGVIAGPPLIAVGITLSRPLEVLAATLFAGSLMAFALLTLVVIVPRLDHWLPQLLLGLSALALLFTMLLALGYAVGGFTGLVALTIPQMVQMHGSGNAFMVTTALFAWVMQRPEPIVEEGDRP